MSELLEDLADAGYPVASVHELRVSGVRYTNAIPALVNHLPRASSSADAEQIVRALSVPWAKPAALKPLIAQFSKPPVPSDPPGELLRWAVGNALWVLWDDAEYDSLLPLILDRRFGKAREMLVLGMAKSRRPEAVSVLLDLLDDPAVDGHALQALRKMKAPVPRTPIERKLTDWRAWVRKDAQRMLARMDGGTKPDCPRDARRV
jgi:hypothetical protein